MVEAPKANLSKKETMEAELISLEEEHWLLREKYSEQHPRVQNLVTRYRRLLREYESSGEG